MEAKKALIMPVLFLCAVSFSGCMDNREKLHYENGWYHVIQGQEDSIAREPIVTVKDIVRLRLDSDYFGKYAIVGQISKHKLKRWGDETEKAIGQKIAFVFNDTVITAPQVNCRIESGTFQITSLSDSSLPAIFKAIRKEKIDSIEVLFTGWEKDSIYNTFSQEQKDSIRLSMDYWDAKAISQGFE